MTKIWSSTKISLQEKERLLGELEKLDKSDRLDNTKKSCQAAHPGNKKMMWEAYFSTAEDSLCADWGLYHYEYSMLGWSQVIHREFTKDLQDEFFDKIGAIMKSKGTHVAKTYYGYLSPSNHSDETSINKYRTLLAKVEKENPEDTTFIRLLKESIESLEIQEKARQCSMAYLNEKK